MAIVPPASELSRRLKLFREKLSKRKLAAALIINVQNVRYLSGFTGGDSALLVTPNKKFLLTDFRYVEEAQHSAKGWSVVTKPAGLMEKVAFLTKKLSIKQVAVEPGSMRLTDMRALRKSLKGQSVKIQPEDGLVGELRLIKSDWEVAQIERALRIQEQCFQELCEGLKVGCKERDAAAYLRYLMVKAGADDQAFEIMFQIGSNASLPHGRPTDRKLPTNAIILLDWGAKAAGYHSDLTRTFFWGKIPPLLRKIHAIVALAQLKAIEKIAPGVAIADVDKVARDVISEAGFGPAFGHSTGHGIGLDIHEAPGVSQRSKGYLSAGMIVTVEPGIYLPGVGGVRIEDDVLVTRDGNRVLSRLPKGLRWTGANE